MSFDLDRYLDEHFRDAQDHEHEPRNTPRESYPNKR